jgi:hypothetical protein
LPPGTPGRTLAVMSIPLAPDRDPRPEHLVPFGPYGGGQMTGHPIGLVIVVGFLLMGLVATPEISTLLFASGLGGALVGFLLWLRH